MLFAIHLQMVFALYAQKRAGETCPLFTHQKNANVPRQRNCAGREAGGFYFVLGQFTTKPPVCQVFSEKKIKSFLAFKVRALG